MVSGLSRVFLKFFQKIFGGNRCGDRKRERIQDVAILEKKFLKKFEVNLPPGRRQGKFSAAPKGKFAFGKVNLRLRRKGRSKSLRDLN